MNFDVLRGLDDQGRVHAFSVSTAGDRLVFELGPWAAGTLYVKTVSGARTDGVIAARFAPVDGDSDLQETATDESGDAVTFTGNGSAALDLVGKRYLILVASTLDTGSGWAVEAWLSVQGDA